jgi:hypothetical protein
MGKNARAMIVIGDNMRAAIKIIIDINPIPNLCDLELYFFYYISERI